MNPNRTSRRALLLGGAALALTACNRYGETPGQRIDRRVDAALQFMFTNIPGSRALYDKAAGALIFPVITEAGFGIGGAYGEGALRVGGVTVDYYSAFSASWGLQIGAQQYSHVLFFMTPESLAEFRASQGWTFGGKAGFVIKDRAGLVAVNTAQVLAPVVALTFGEAGIIIGAKIEGTKYTRINR
ncbi:MAG: twin-arginine translocation pathway signal [Alphaproteobacteria bacterium]|nr:MAG: twin-arginine translocation pathway signal [Alphaproteobacteria bacterium]